MIEIHRAAVGAGLVAVASVALTGCAPQSEDNADEETHMQPTAPQPTKRPKELTTHGDTRIDNYYWMRDDSRKNEEVLAHLRAENAYAEAIMAHTKSTQDMLYAELKGRIKEDDESVPIRLGNYWYSTRYSKGQEHPVYQRRSELGSDPETILDVNVLSEPYEFYNVRGVEVSPDGRYLAYSEDSVGRNERVVRIKDLSTGETLSESIPMNSGDLEWANDNKTLFYVKLQQGTLIPYRVYRHILGRDHSEDALVYEEPDETFLIAMEKSRTDEQIIIAANAVLLDSVPQGSIVAGLPAEVKIRDMPESRFQEYFESFRR